MQKKRGFFYLSFVSLFHLYLYLTSLFGKYTSIFRSNFFQITKMMTYSIKQLMGLCSDYALDAQIQKILFSLDLWVPKAARVSFIFLTIYLFFHTSTFSRKYKLIMLHNNNILQVLSRDLIVLGLLFRLKKYLYIIYFFL